MYTCLLGQNFSMSHKTYNYTLLRKPLFFQLSLHNVDSTSNYDFVNIVSQSLYDQGRHQYDKRQIEILSSDRTQLLELRENWISIGTCPEKWITISGPIDDPAQSEPENLTCLILNLGGDVDNPFQSAPIKASSVGLA